MSSDRLIQKQHGQTYLNAARDTGRVVCIHCGDSYDNHDWLPDGGRNPLKPECPGFDPGDDPKLASADPLEDLADILQRSIRKASL